MGWSSTRIGDSGAWRATKNTIRCKRLISGNLASGMFQTVPLLPSLPWGAFSRQPDHFNYFLSHVYMYSGIDPILFGGARKYISTNNGPYLATFSRSATPGFDIVLVKINLLSRTEDWARQGVLRKCMCRPYMWAI